LSCCHSDNPPGAGKVPNGLSRERATDGAQRRSPVKQGEAGGTTMNTKRRRQPDDKTKEDTGAPTIEQQDWDAIQSGEIAPESVPADRDISYPPSTVERSGDLPEEDDDNPYQESDEALPDDVEEAALARDPSKERSPSGDS
jgi:hypothetical protein